MTISEYVCELCEYRFEGCSGLGVLESGWALQTVSCADCRALHDTKLEVNLWSARGERTKRGRRHQTGDEEPTMETILAGLAFACPVDASHAVRPWTNGESGWTVPGAIDSVCPLCESHVHRVRDVMLVD